MTTNASVDQPLGSGTNTAVMEVNLISFIVLILFTTVANFLTLVVLMKNKRLHLPYHLHTLSLITVDILVAVSLIPLRIVNVVDKELWHTSPVFCQMYLRLSVVYSLVSVFTLGCITVECYLALKHQRRYRHVVTVRNVFVFNILIWVSALAISFLASLTPTSDPNSKHCAFIDVYGQGFLPTYVCLGVLLPLSSVFIINCKAVKSSLKQCSSVGVTGAIPYLEDVNDPISVPKFGAWSRVILKLLVTFMIFWIPRCVVLLYKDESKPSSGVFQVVDDLTEVYTYCFFAAVPLVLGSCSEEFRETFERILCPFQEYKQQVQYKRKYGRSPTKVWPYDREEPRVP